MDYFKPIIEFLALEIFDLYQTNKKKFINKAYEEIIELLKSKNNNYFLFEEMIEKIFKLNFEWSPIILLPPVKETITLLMLQVDMDIKNSIIINPIRKFFQQRYTDLNTFSENPYSKYFNTTYTNTQKLNNCKNIIKNLNKSNWVFTTNLEIALACRALRVQCILINNNIIENSIDKYRDFLHIANQDDFVRHFDVSKYLGFKNEDRFQNLVNFVANNYDKIPIKYKKLFL
jgi:hypothetical protein